MLGEEGLMVPCELLDPAHPQAGNLWHLNYVCRQSTVPVLPKQAVLRFSLLVETPIYSRFSVILFSEADECDFLGWELANGFPPAPHPFHQSLSGGRAFLQLAR